MKQVFTFTQTELEKIMFEYVERYLLNGDAGYKLSSDLYQSELNIEAEMEV